MQFTRTLRTTAPVGETPYARVRVRGSAVPVVARTVMVKEVDGAAEGLDGDGWALDVTWDTDWDNPAVYYDNGVSLFNPEDLPAVNVAQSVGAALDGELLTHGVGAGQLNTSGGRADADVKRWLDADVLLDASSRPQVSVLAYNGNTLDLVGGLNAATFFNNAGTIPGTLLEDVGTGGVGGTGLTAQETRDALALPLTVAAQPGSIDAQLAALGDIAGIPGPGADPCTVRVLVAGVPVADADVWVTSSFSGPAVAGTLQTDSAGEVTFMLDAGVSYHLWAQKDGLNAIRGEEFIAVADL